MLRHPITGATYDPRWDEAIGNYGRLANQRRAERLAEQSAPSTIPVHRVVIWGVFGALAMLDLLLGAILG